MLCKIPKTQYQDFHPFLGIEYLHNHKYIQQTQAIAAAAAGVAAEGLSPQESKVEAENAAHLSVALAENAVVILMLVEDHLRMQGQLYCISQSIEGGGTPKSATSSRSNSLSRSGSESLRSSLSSEPSGLPLDVRDLN